MFRELLKNDFIIFDGAMGTMLQGAGMKMGETPEALSITDPELLVGIHEKYIRAGAQVVYSNTFGANRYKLEECGYSVEEVVKASIANAKKASSNVEKETGRKALVALDIGPIGQLLEPTGLLSFEAAQDYMPLLTPYNLNYCLIFLILQAAARQKIKVREY